MTTPSTFSYEIVKTLPIEDVVALYKSGGWWEEREKSRTNIPAMIKGSFCCMVVRHEGKVIGMGRVISDGFSDGYIQDIVVKKEYRRQGIGGELVRRLALFCVEQDLEWIGLVAKPNTAKFYERLGFRVLNNYQPMILKKELLL